METNSTKSKKKRKKPSYPLLQEYLADPSLGMDEQKLTEIWNSGVANNVTGRSLLGSLMAQPTFEHVDKLHDLLKNQMITSTVKKAYEIGKIYMKAWKTACEERKQVIENDCIQKLIRASLLTKMQIAEYCLEALRPLIDQGQLLSIDCMLYDLAEPLIWRHLDSTNCEIRFNAISLLLALFPLREKNQTPLEALNLLEKELDMFHKYLSDRGIEIRVKTISGLCKILSLYWEIIPQSNCSKFLNELINELALDTTSANVRVAVLKGMIVILQNNMSHLALSKLLPKLKNAINDRAESVRSAMVDLLLELRGLVLIKYWDVVSMDHILRRLAADKSHSICERIVKLLAPSLFPEELDDSARLDRVEELFKLNVVAPRKFYQYAAKFVPLELIVDQILLFIRCSYGYTKTTRSNSSADSSASVSNDETSGDEIRPESGGDKTVNSTAGTSPNTSTPIDIPVLVNFLDCAAILWNSIGSELSKDEHVNLKKKLYQFGSTMIVRCARHFENQPAMTDSLLVLIGFMGKASARYVSSSLNKKFKAIEDGGFDRKLHGTLVETLCFLQLDDVVNLVLKWWQNYSSPLLTSPLPTNPKRVRISVPEITDIPNSRLGIQVIAYLLDRNATRKYILNHIEKVQALATGLDQLWEHCMALPDKSIFDARWTTEILKLRSIMACLLSAKKGATTESSKFLASFMDLLRINIFPVYKSSVIDETNDTDASLNESQLADKEEKFERAKAIMQISFTIWSDFIMCGQCDVGALIMATDLTNEILQNENDSNFRVEIAKLIYHILDYIRNHGVPPETTELLSPWIDKARDFTAKNPGLFNGMDEVDRLVKRFCEVLGKVTS